MNLSLFLNPHQDFEKAQYRVLGSLYETRSAFSRNVIYPHLSDLIHLHNQLETIVQQLDELRDSMAGEIEGVDVETARVLRSAPEMGDEQLGVLEDLIRWALPKIRSTIEEGRSVYEHVEENTELETVGIVPKYLQEGYLMVPERQVGDLHVLRYELSIIQEEGEKHRALRTVHCKTVSQDWVDVHPSTIKLDLLEERRDLPNPATYFSNTALSVPYEETLLPVVKRRLIRHLSLEMGRGQ